MVDLSNWCDCAIPHDPIIILPQWEQQQVVVVVNHSDSPVWFVWKWILYTVTAAAAAGAAGEEKRQRIIMRWTPLRQLFPHPPQQIMGTTEIKMVTTGVLQVQSIDNPKESKRVAM
jgi:hypothetical protein